MPNIIKENLLKLYGVEINKSEDSPEIEKGGEGSRGGKVIGHTKSGLPVYANLNAEHEKYSKFTNQDHKEASRIHEDYSELELTPTHLDHHLNMSDSHRDRYQKQLPTKKD